MDGPKNTGIPTAGSQVQQTGNIESQSTKTSGAVEGKAFNRSVKKTGETIPFHSKSESSGQGPEQRPLSERTVKTSDVTAEETVFQPQEAHDQPRSTQPPAPRQRASESNHTYRALYDHQELMFNSAISVAKQTARRAKMDGDTSKQEKLEAVASELTRQLQSIKDNVDSKDGDSPVSKPDKKSGKKLPKNLQKQLINSGIDKQTVQREFRRAQADQLNGKGWDKFHREFTDPYDPACTMASEQVPACEMGKVFTSAYDKGTGVSCVDTTNTTHANNLWKSNFAIKGRAVFNGIRHGIIDAAGLGRSANRGAAAQKKAEEVLIAALASKPELYQQALEAAGDGGNMPPPKLLATSTSLVTTGAGSAPERKMQVQQNRAFRALIKKAKKNVLELDVPGSDGKTRKVKFELKLSRFNIPVNFGGVGTFQKITSGRLFQRTMNKPAMAELVGRGRSIGGDAASHLRHIESQVKQIQQQLSKVKPDQRIHLERDIRRLRQEKKIVTQLASQVKQIYRRGSHHSEGHDTYKLAARVVYLTHLIGGVPLYNCKSGKDRTGMLDAEVKLLAARIERDGSVPPPGRLEMRDQQLFRAILLNTGNHEVQKTNVGVQGYKTEMIDSITERVGDDEVREEVRGLSQVTSK